MTIRNLFPDQLPSLSLNFAKVKALDPRVTFIRASSATYVDASGTWREVTNNVPRFDHNPTTKESLGLLVEAQRTNLNTNPRAEGSTVGVPGGVPSAWSVPTMLREIVGQTTINGVDGLLVRFNGIPTDTGLQEINNNSDTVSIGTTVTNSLFVALVAGTLTNVSSFILRCSGESGGTTFTPTGTLTRYVNTRVTTSTSSSTTLRWNYLDTVTPVDFTLFVGWLQREHAEFATSPILPPVSTLAASTRAADSASMTGANFSSWYRSDEGTMLINFNRFGTDGNPYPLSIGTTGPTSAPRINLRLATSSNTQTISTQGVGALTSWNSASFTGTVDFNTQARAVMAYSAASVAGCLNGNTVLQVDSPTYNVPTGVNTFFIGFNGGLNATIQRVSYYPYRASNTELQALTR